MHGSLQTMQIWSRHRRAEGAPAVIASAGAISAAPDQASRRKGFFAKFIEALHESRRCQAACEIHRYQHLIHEARAYARPARGRLSTIRNPKTKSAPMRRSAPIHED